MKRSLALVVIVLAALLGAQMPNSPTGRMAGALADLANTTGERALTTFVDQLVAPSARDEVTASLRAMRSECANSEVAGARRAGASEAVITLALADGRCEVRFALENVEPHRLVSLGLEVMLGDQPGGNRLALDLPAGDDEALVRALDAQLRRLTEDGAFSGVVLLARHGEPFFQRAYGLADRASGRANTVDTRFDIGSITKLLTRVAIAQLLQAGTLELDDTIIAHLPDYPNPEIGGRVTIQHLLDHSSGLGDIFNDRWPGADKSRMLTPRDFFPLFVDQPLQFEPGQRRSYSNAGFVVLGAIVESASGQPYSDYLARRVFDPAGMEHSGFPRRDGTATDLAIGYTREGGPDLESNLGQLPLRGCPAGSSSHTASDLLQLDRALRAGKLLDPRWSAWVYTRELGPAEVDGSGPWAIGVAGGGPGVNAIIEGDEAALAVVLSNFDPPAAEELGIELYRALRAGR